MGLLFANIFGWMFALSTFIVTHFWHPHISILDYFWNLSGKKYIKSLPFGCLILKVSCNFSISKYWNTFFSNFPRVEFLNLSFGSNTPFMSPKTISSSWNSSIGGGGGVVVVGFGGISKKITSALFITYMVACSNRHSTWVDHKKKKKLNYAYMALIAAPKSQIRFSVLFQFSGYRNTKWDQNYLVIAWWSWMSVRRE